MIELTSKLSSVVSHVNQQSFDLNQSTDCDTAPFCRWQGANGDRPHSAAGLSLSAFGGNAGYQ
jgi:hypothetical protein